MRWIWVIFFLLAGGSTGTTSATQCGAFAFDSETSLMLFRWSCGSAYLYKLIAGGTADNTSAIGGTFSLSVADLFTKTGESYGSALFFLFTLIAGGCAYNSGIQFGAFTLDINGSPSNTWWASGSAYIYQ